MKIIVLGADGFCGWPTSLELLSRGHEVCLVDNLARRKIDEKLDTKSLTKLHSFDNRLKVASEVYNGVTYKNIDVSKDVTALKNLISAYRPDTIIHFAEQRAAPYSMLGDQERRYTVDNNVTGTSNILSAIVEIDPRIHLVHLGTMGVYGYSKENGPIPEGYLNVKINQTQKDVDILYPANPGSVYHMTKCLDQLMFQYYNKNWNLRITDLHQGIVWGTETKQTKLRKEFINRFDYDGIYGTVLNRFLVQSANEVPLTVYGSGGQTRAFIHISDTARCVALAAERCDFAKDHVRIFNQVAEVYRLSDLAKLVSELFGSKIQYLENPRKELAENELQVSNAGLRSLGFDPIMLNEGLIEEIKLLADQSKESFDTNTLLNSPKW